MSMSMTINSSADAVDKRLPVQVKIEEPSSSVDNSMRSSRKRGATTNPRMDATDVKRATRQLINDESIPELVPSQSYHLHAVEPIPQHAPVEPFHAVAIKVEQEEGSLMHPVQPPAQSNVAKVEHKGATAVDHGSILAIEHSLIDYMRNFRDDSIIDIPRKQLESLPLYQRKSRILVISSAAASDKAVSDIRTELSLVQQNHHQKEANHPLRKYQFISFDLEGTVRYPFCPPVLIQLCTCTTTYLFRLRYDDMQKEDNALTPSLRSLISDPNIIKIGLHKEPGLCCGDGQFYLDMSRLVKHRWQKVRCVGKYRLAAAVLHCKLRMVEQKNMKCWETRALNQHMEEHAAANASLVLDLFMAMIKSPQNVAPVIGKTPVAYDTTTSASKKASLTDIEHALMMMVKKQTASLPLYQRKTSRIVVITSMAASDKAVFDIRTELLRTHQNLYQGGPNHPLKMFQCIGFDVETTPRRKNFPVLIQLATLTTIYLFRLKYDGMNMHDSPMTPSLRGLLSDQNIVKIGLHKENGFGTHDIVRELNPVYGVECCGNGQSYLELSRLMKRRWPHVESGWGKRRFSKAILHCNLGSSIHKDWEMHELTSEMIKYAAANASIVLNMLMAMFPINLYATCQT